MRFSILAAISLGSAVAITSTVGLACPFCTAVSQTFSEEIESMEVAVIARLVQAPDPAAAESSDPNAPLPKAMFRVEQVLKGDNWVQPSVMLELLYFGEPDMDKRYLAMATDPPALMWSTPLGLSERAYQYVLKLPSLPKDAARLEFFQEHLEDSDEMLARDAYDEFAKIPYKGVVDLKDKMHHDRLIGWVQDLEIPASRRRLYLTMLGVCGTPEDAELLEKMIRSDDPKIKAGRDAMIACYLILRGPEGLPLIEDLFLKNEKAEYADTYAAIMAIRFHGTETQVIEKASLVRALRHMLRRAELADLVIPDLARWEDWEVMPQLVELFRQADDKSSWVRVPVINYLRVCPLPEAKRQIEELSKIDPDAVKRAETFFPFDTTGDAQTTPGQPAASEASDPPTAEPADPPAGSPTVPQPVAPADETAAAGKPASRKSVARVPAASAGQPADERHRGTPRLAQANADAAEDPADRPAWKPNLLQLWGVPMLVGLGLLVVLRLVLGLPLLRFRA